MAGKNTINGKAERPSYDNKAVAPAASVNVRIRVLKAHDGLEAGSEWLKPLATAKTMQTLGYWEIL
jgi:hypothetical protein